MSDAALSIYCALPMDLKVTLMEKPHGVVPADLVSRLNRLPNTFAGMTTWTSNPRGSEAFTLHGALPDRLERIRERLDQWWSTLDDDVQEHLIQNRNGYLDGHYKSAVMCAGDGTIDGLIVSVVQDTETGTFRLPPIVDVYVELVSR